MAHAIFAALMVGVIPMFFGIEYVSEMHEYKRGHEIQKEYERSVKEAWSNPPYNMRRQMYWIHSIEEHRGFEEFYEYLGYWPTTRIIQKWFTPEDTNHVRKALIRAVAEKEGWELYMHPLTPGFMYEVSDEELDEVLGKEV